MNIKKLSKTIVTALAITVLSISGLGLAAYAHEGHEGEKDWLVGPGWQYEGVGWKVIE